MIIRDFRLTPCHRSIRAIAEIELNGILLRGLKLEQSKDGFFLSMAGRKVNKCWQQVYDLSSELQKAILKVMVALYRQAEIC